MVCKAQKLRSFALCNGLNRPFVCTCETQILTSLIYVLPSSQDTNLCTHKNKPLNCSLCSTKTSTFSLSYCCSFVTFVPNMLFFITFHFKNVFLLEYINKPTKGTSLVMLVLYILYTYILSI